MKSTSKTKVQLLEELSGLRSRVAELEKRHDKGNGKKVNPAVARVDRTRLGDKKKATAGRVRGNKYPPSGKTRVEEAIQETEAQFRVALEDGTVPMATLNPDLQLVEVNRAFCDLLGYAKQELKGRIIKDIIHPDDVEQSVDLTTRVFNSGLPSFQFENRFLTKSHTIIWCNVAATAVCDREGKPTYLFVTIENITERKRAEIALGEKKKEYEQLVNSGKGIVWEADLSTFQFTLVSQEAERLLGYPCKRWIEEPTFWRDHIHPEDRDWAIEYCIKNSAQKDYYEFEYRMIAANGDVVWLRDLVTVVRDKGKRIKLQGVMVDISELKQAESSLAGQKAILEQIALSTPLSEILTSLCHTIEAQLDGLFCSILLLEGDKLRHGAAPSLPDAYNQAIDGMTIGPTAGSCGTAAFRKEQVVVTDIATDPLCEPYKELLLTHGLRACWSTPIRSSEGIVLGTFAMYYTQPRFPDSKEQELVRMSTYLAGIAIERRRSEEALKARAHQQALVAELGQSALTGLDLPTLMHNAVSLIAQTLEVKYCKVLELLPDGKELILRAVFGCPADAVNHITVGAGLDSQAGYTLVSDKPVIVDDLRTETRFSGPPLLHQLGVISGVSVIISGKPHHYGVLGVHSTQLRRFTRDDIHFVQAVANVVALAIERKRMEEALRISEQAIRELYEITSAPETSFESRVRALLELGCQRFNLPIGLVTRREGDHFEMMFIRTGEMVEDFVSEGSRIPMCDLYCGAALEAEEPICFGHASTSDWATHRGFATTGLEAYLGTKIVVSGDKYGTLCFAGPEPFRGTFTEGDKDFLQLMAHWIEGEIERQQAEDTLKERSQLAGFDARISYTLTQGENLNQILHGCTEIMVSDLGAAFARIWTLNTQDQILELQASSGLYTHLDGPHSQIPVGQLKIGMIASECRPHLTNTVIGDPRVPEQEWANREGMVAFAGYPLLVDGRVIGVMAMFARHPLTEFTLQMLESVADRIAMGIERKRTEKALKAQQVFLRQVIDINPNFVFAKNREGRFTLVNQAVADVYGTTVEDLLGKTDSDFNSNVEEVEVFRRIDLEVMDSKQERFIAEETITDAAGQIHWLQTVKRPLFNDEGVVDQVLGVATDITARKQAEDTLRAIVEGTAAVTSVDFFHSLLRHLTVALGAPYAFIAECVDATNTRVRTLAFLNRGTFIENVEYALEGTPCEEVIAGKVCYHPQDIQRLFPRDTDLVDLDVQSYFGLPLQDSSGKVIGHLVIMSQQSVTFDAQTESLLRIFAARAGAELERIQAEEALRESEEHLRFVTDNSPVGIAHCDQTQRYKFVNQHFAEMFGRQKSDIVGMSPRELLGEDVYAYASPYLEAVLAGQYPEYDFVLPATSRGQRTVHIRYAPERDTSGQVVGYVASLTDITERKQTEADLKASEERYAMVMGAINDGILDWEVATETVYYSPAWKKQLGYEDHEVQNVYEEWTSRIHPEDYDRVMAALKDHFGWNRSYELEYRLRHKDGSYVWILTRGACIRDEQGRPTRMFGSNSDVTQRRQAEEQVRHAEVQLRHSQKMNALGTLAGGIAHDFNNILAALMGYTELILNKVPYEKTVQGYLTEVLKAGSRAKELVQQILTFSRQTEGQKKPLHFQEVIQEVLMLIRATLPSTIKIQVQLSASSDLVQADATQIHQVLMNLCTNAEYAMRDRGGVLSLRLETVEEDAADGLMPHLEFIPGPHLLLTVQDTGHGMAPQVLDRIFDPFFTTKKPGEGTGMGLAVVHGIIADHQGRITVTSIPGEGTIVSIVFPLLAAASTDTSTDTDTVEAEAELPSAASLHPGQGRVLLVDDEAPLVALGKEVLEELGYEVTPHTSSLEALEAFRAAPSRYDVVITDQTMPNLSGEALAREILRIRPDIPIVLCTGFSQTMTEEKARELGIRKFLMKPILRHDLVLVLQEVLAEVEIKD